MSSLSNGQFNYNRFDGKLNDDVLANAYRAIYEKKADKDYDGDGKVESGSQEYLGSRDKAIKKAMGKSVKEGEEKKDLPPFMKDKKEDKKGEKKDKCECKEEVCQYLVDEGFTNNLVSAEVLFNHMSQEWMDHIEESMLEPDMKKRQKNNEKAIKDMKKVKDDTVPRWMQKNG